MQKFKQLIKAIAYENLDIFKTFINNILRLVKMFWRQSWKKRIIDLCLSILIISCVTPLGFIIFTMSMGNNLEHLSLYQTLIYYFIMGFISTILFINFAEIFILLSLGGMALFTSSCYDSIIKRMEQLNGNNNLAPIIS